MKQKSPVAVAPPPPLVAPTRPAVEAPAPVPEPPPPAQNAATAPPKNVEPTGEEVEAPEQADEAVEHAEQPEPSDSGVTLVSRQPVSVLASPSSSAPAMYGFPAGRPFRVIGRDRGFAHIQDLKSGASGWIDETALAPPPRVPTASPPSQTKPFAVSRNPTNPWTGLKTKATKNDTTGAADSDQPLNRIAGALAYLVEGVSSGVSSATVTSLRLYSREPTGLPGRSASPTATGVAEKSRAFAIDGFRRIGRELPFDLSLEAY